MTSGLAVIAHNWPRRHDGQEYRNTIRYGIRYERNRRARYPRKRTA